MSTYESITLDSKEGLKCHLCGTVTYNPKYLEYLFCPGCQKFHKVPDPVGLTEAQYQALLALKEGRLPPSGATDNPHLVMGGIFAHGLLEVNGETVYISSRGLQAMEEHEKVS